MGQKMFSHAANKIKIRWTTIQHDCGGGGGRVEILYDHDMHKLN